MTEHSQNFIISCGMIIQSFMLKRSTMCATWKNSQYPKTRGIVKLRYINWRTTTHLNCNNKIALKALAIPSIIRNDQTGLQVDQ